MATRERDSKGRFVKKQPQEVHNNENDVCHDMLRTYNRLADGGEEYGIEEARKHSLMEVWALRGLVVVFLCFLLWLVFGCTTKRVVEYVPMEKKVTETVVLTDTVVQVQLVPYKDSVSVKDSASYLENAYAYSHASVCGGTLNHSLGVFPQKPVPVKTVYVTKILIDSIPYAVPGPVQYVDKKMSLKECILLWGGVFVMIIITLFVISFFIKKIFG